MKRDMDAVRSLLLAMESSPEFLFIMDDMLQLVDGDDETVGLILMLKSGGFLETSKDGHAYRVSWAGHEFLDTIRDPEIWRQTKAGATKVGSWSVKLLAELATGYIRAKAHELGLPISG